METCKNGHELSPDNVYQYSSGGTGCLTCRRSYSAKQRRQPEWKAKAQARSKAWRKVNYQAKVKFRVQEIRQRLLAVRTQCSKCGETHPGCLDFHHRIPEEKSFALIASQMGNRSWKTIETEIAKCDVLCSNCHRKLHHDMRQKES